MSLIAAHCRWEHAGQSFFDGEVEACINGRTLAIGAYLGVDVTALADRLVGEQLADGGWNSETENGSVRGSFHSTICVLEGLFALERHGGASALVGPARLRGQEYLLERRLFRRLSTGGIVDEDWLTFAFPTYWHYDVLRGLDYFRSVGGLPDARLADAIELVRSRRGPDGAWPVEHRHRGATHVDVDDEPGARSPWNTLRAVRVLDWYDGATSRPSTSTA